MTDEEVLRVASECGWNVEHRATNDYIITFARALMDKQRAWFTVDELNEWANKLPQTTHWEGCEEVHPECRKPEPVAWELRMGKTDRVLMEITNNPERAQNWRASLCEVVPLYYAPTPRKPLTVFEIDAIAERLDKTTIGWATHEFAAAIERAHGITGEQT